MEQFARDVDLILKGQAVEEISDKAYQADLALTKTLSHMQFKPDPRFESRLRGKLLQKLYEDEREKEVRTMSLKNMFRSLVRPVLVAGVSAAVVLGVVFAASPDVRAAAGEWVARFVEVDSPWTLLPETENQPVAESPPDLSTEDVASVATEGAPSVSVGETVVVTSGQGVKEVATGELPEPERSQVEPRSELISLEEAQAELDFKIRIPSVLPDGYDFLGVVPRPDLPATLPDVGVEPPDDLPKVKPPQMALLIFGNEDGEMLSLSEMYVADSDRAVPNVPLPAGEGAVQDVTVNGQSAQYVEGMWTEDGWGTGGHYQLHWQDGDILYDLISRTLDLEELLSIAESIK
jgi:hypothetical protein